MEKFLRVGVITNSHGINGEVKVYPTTEDVKRFDYLKEAIIDTGKERIPVHITGTKYYKNMVILKFKEFNNINQILEFKQKDLLVTRENAIQKDDGKYFISDLLGCSIVTDEGKTLGELTDVLQTGANDVYVATMTDGREVLLPVIEQCVLKKDIENRQITIHVMKGLLD